MVVVERFSLEGLHSVEPRREAGASVDRRLTFERLTQNGSTGRIDSPQPFSETPARPKTRSRMPPSRHGMDGLACVPPASSTPGSTESWSTGAGIGFGSECERP